MRKFIAVCIGVCFLFNKLLNINIRRWCERTSGTSMPAPLGKRLFPLKCLCPLKLKTHLLLQLIMNEWSYIFTSLYTIVASTKTTLPLPTEEYASGDCDHDSDKPNLFHPVSCIIHQSLKFLIRRFRERNSCHWQANTRGSILSRLYFFFILVTSLPKPIYYKGGLRHVSMYCEEPIRSDCKKLTVFNTSVILIQ